MKKLTDFEKGILTACAIIQATHDEPPKKCHCHLCDMEYSATNKIE